MGLASLAVIGIEAGVSWYQARKQAEAAKAAAAQQNQTIAGTPPPPDLYSQTATAAAQAKAAADRARMRAQGSSAWRIRTQQTDTLLTPSMPLVGGNGGGTGGWAAPTVGKVGG